MQYEWNVKAKRFSKKDLPFKKVHKSRSVYAAIHETTTGKWHVLEAGYEPRSNYTHFNWREYSLASNFFEGSRLSLSENSELGNDSGVWTSYYGEHPRYNLKNLENSLKHKSGSLRSSCTLLIIEVPSLRILFQEKVEYHRTSVPKTPISKRHFRERFLPKNYWDRFEFLLKKGRTPAEVRQILSDYDGAYSKDSVGCKGSNGFHIVTASERLEWFETYFVWEGKNNG